MGLNIGSLLSDIKLPKLDLSSIGSDILTEGKSLLSDVVKDSFTLSNQPGQTFASSISADIGGSNVSLPNPIGALANKLLSGADSELGKIGVNINFKQVAQELFHLPTQSGGSVTVPSTLSRAASGSLATSPQALVSSGASGVGGGGAAASSGVGGSVLTTNTPGTEFSSSGNYSVGVGGGFTGALNGVGNAEATANGDLMAAMSQTPDSSGMITVNGQQVNAQAYLAEMQQQMNTLNQMFETISNIMQAQNQTNMNTIGNIKG